jgi:DNA-binding transcriptional LysR family regulator
LTSQNRLATLAEIQRTLAFTQAFEPRLSAATFTLGLSEHAAHVLLPRLVERLRRAARPSSGGGTARPARISRAFAPAGLARERALRPSRRGTGEARPQAPPRATVPQMYAAPTLIARSDMIATLTAGVVDASGHGDKLRVLAPPLDLDLVPYVLSWHRRNGTHPAQRWLRDTIASLFPSD